MKGKAVASVTMIGVLIAGIFVAKGISGDSVDINSSTIDDESICIDIKVEKEREYLLNAYSSLAHEVLENAGIIASVMDNNKLFDYSQEEVEMINIGLNGFRLIGKEWLNIDEPERDNNNNEEIYLILKDTCVKLTEYADELEQGINNKDIEKVNVASKLMSEISNNMINIEKIIN